MGGYDETGRAYRHIGASCDMDALYDGPKVDWLRAVVWGAMLVACAGFWGYVGYKLVQLAL